jgi:adenylate kinase family enzyme
LARELAALLGVPQVELDGVFHQPGWAPLAEDEFQRVVAAAVAEDGWVIDGNYSAVRTLVWARADTVVWLDLPRRTVMRQVVWRTLRRAVTRQELWNGNREPLRNFLTWAPEESVISWAWHHHGTYRDRYGAAAVDPANAHLTFVRLTSRRGVRLFLAEVSGLPGGPVRMLGGRAGGARVAGEVEERSPAAEHEHLPASAGQGRQGPEDPPAILVEQRCLLRRQRRTGRLLSLLLGVTMDEPSPSQRRAAPVDHRRAEVVLRVAVHELGALVQADEDVLHDVLGGAPVAEDERGYPDQLGPVRPERLIEATAGICARLHVDDTNCCRCWLPG